MKSKYSYKKKNKIRKSFKKDALRKKNRKSKNKTIKTKKIIEFVEIYKKDKQLNEEESNNLTKFLKDCLDKKKLSRVKDVIYDKVNGIVKEIPALTYSKANKHFTLKNIDKRISTLKSLAPKKIHGTIRNKFVQHDNDNNTPESDEEVDN